jgi:hypothetical protein
MQTIKFPNADATDEEDLPSGHVYIHDLDEVINPDDIPNVAFQYVVVTPILSKTVDESKLSQQRLDEAIPQYVADPFTLLRRDSVPVNAELGSQDACAGIFKTVDGRDTRYWVIAQAGAPIACKQLKQKIKNDMTWRQLLDDPDYHYAMYAAERNTKKLAYNVARAARVPIRHEPDIGSYATPGFGTPSHRAKGGLLQATSTITRVGAKSVAVYHRVRPAENANAECMVHSGPYEGFTLFNMAGKAKTLGLPADVGRAAGALDSACNPERANGIQWEGRVGNAIHADLHPQTFNAIDDNFLSAMTTLGWKQEGVRSKLHFVPVMVKIFNPEIKRRQ